MTKFARCVNPEKLQLTNRNIKPIARKSLFYSKQPQGHIPQGLPLVTTLPAEILDEILGIVLKHGMLESTKQQSPNISLRQYRALIMTCKLFKAIVDNACLKVTIRCVDLLTRRGNYILEKITRILVSPWDDFKTADTQEHCGRLCNHATSLKRWNGVFKSFQLVSVRHMSSFNTASLGRFWHNPLLQLDDFPHIDPPLLHHLRPLFERTKRPPTNVERERFVLTPQLPYTHGEIVNVITRTNKKLRTYSVRTWNATKIHLCSLSISARVKEWWIIEVNFNQWITNTYIVGYYRKWAMVVHVDEWQFHQTYASKKPAWR